MSPIPDFVVELRELVGTHPLWLPAVTAVVRRGDEVLLVRRADNGAWTPVTGILDPGEEPAVAAAREALEETGVVISVDRLVSTAATPEVVHVNGDRATYLDLTFACTWLSGEAHVADDESTEVRWWPRDGLPPMSQEMHRRLDDVFADQREARFVAAGSSSPSVPEPLRPERPVLGVDVCATGWVGVLLGPDARATVHVATTLTDLVDLVRQTADPAVVAIGTPTDIPIGLADPGTEVIEVHPEVCFARMGEAPVAASKKEPAGVAARRDALSAHGFVAPPWFRGSGFDEDDLLDACAAVWAAVWAAARRV